MKGKLTLDRLKSLIRYDPESGQLTYRVTEWKRYVGREAGYINKQGYRYVQIDGYMYRAHWLAWLYMTGAWPSKEVDHQNLDPSDNRWKNLRAATSSQNKFNTRKPKHNKSGFKGVSKATTGTPWRAKIAVNGKQIYLGRYNTKEEAYAAYVQAAEQFHGEFARVA